MKELPIPSHFDPQKAASFWRVPYEARAKEAQAYAREHGLKPASKDERRIALLLIDVQNTFCLPEFELFVAGRSGMGAVEDNQRLCAFIYRNLGNITRIVPTMDTHQAMQIFHAVFLVDEKGEPPPPFTLVSVEDVESGRLRFNPQIAPNLGLTPEEGQRHLLHYVRALKAKGKYELTIWPYHAMLGGIGHALVSVVEEAIFFHTLARLSQPPIQIKGNHPLTEHYSVFGPEVLEDADGHPIASKNASLIDMLLGFDAVAVAGQAKSHCVAWSIEDLLSAIQKRDPRLAQKVYLLEDCTSPVVIPGVIDYTEIADAAFRHFAEAGMHIVRSTEPMDTWPGIGETSEKK